MATVTYQNTSTRSLRVFRYGSTSKRVNGVYTANQLYRSELTSCDGKIVVSTEPLTEASTTPTSVLNRLYDKVRESVQGPKGALLTSSLEWRESLGMIAKRSAQLRAAYSAVRRLDLKRAANILGMSSRDLRSIRKRVKGRAASPTELWLEFWMGWAPLHGDIGHALETLSRAPALNQHFRVGVSYTGTKFETIDGDSKSSTSRFYERSQCTMKGRYAAYGSWKVTNHNYQLTQQLGFANPALTAWELVPFSFIVDWFTNVGQVLGALTDFMGVEFTNTGIGVSREYSFFRIGFTAEAINGQYLRRYYSGGGTRTVKARNPWGFPTPRLSIELPRLSLTRAATAISLLTENFLRK